MEIGHGWGHADDWADCRGIAGGFHRHIPAAGCHVPGVTTITAGDLRVDGRAKLLGLEQGINAHAGFGRRRLIPANAGQARIVRFARVVGGMIAAVGIVGLPAGNFVEHHHRPGNGLAGQRVKDIAAGVMQLDNPSPTARMIWDWKANIDSSKALLEEKKQAATQFVARIRRDHPAAPDLTSEQLSLEVYQRYNGGGYWDWNVANSSWIIKPNSGYGDACLAIEKQVQAGHPPADW